MSKDFKDILGADEALQIIGNLTETTTAPQQNTQSWVLKKISESQQRPSIDVGKFANEFGYKITPSGKTEEIEGKKYTALALSNEQGYVAYLYFEVSPKNFIQESNGSVKNKPVMEVALIGAPDNKALEIVQENIRFHDNFSEKVDKDFYLKVVRDKSLSIEDKNLLLLSKAMTSEIDKRYDPLKSNLFLIGEDHGTRICATLNEVCRQHINKFYKPYAAAFEFEESKQSLISSKQSFSIANVPKDIMLQRTYLDSFKTGKPTKILALDMPHEDGSGHTTKVMDERDAHIIEKLKNSFNSHPGNENITLNCGAAHLTIAKNMASPQLNVIPINTSVADAIVTERYKHLVERNNYSKSSSVITAVNSSDISIILDKKLNDMSFTEAAEKGLYIYELQTKIENQIKTEQKQKPSPQR